MFVLLLQQAMSALMRRRRRQPSSIGEAGAVRRKNEIHITSANICNKDFSSLICYIGSVVAQKTKWANYILIVRGT